MGFPAATFSSFMCACSLIMTKSCYQSDLEHLPTSKVLELLSLTDHGVITRPPTNSKGGNVYLYSYGENILVRKVSLLHCFMTVINLILQEVA